MNPLTDKSYLVSLVFRDARSYRAVQIPLSPGLNVFVGDSDSGKSNIVRNIRSVLENDTAAAMTRDGSDHSEVRLGFADGTDVWLSKGPKTNEYAIHEWTGVEINGDREIKSETFRSVGSSVPPRVREALNMGVVDLQGEPVMISLAAQRGASFGVDESPAAVARAVGSVSAIDRLYSAVAEAERIRKAAAKAAGSAADAAREAKLRARASRAGWDPARARERLSGAQTALDAAGTARERARDIRDRSERAAQTARKRSRALIPARDGSGALERARGALERAREARERVRALRDAIGARERAGVVRASAAEAVIRESAAAAKAKTELAEAIREAGVCPLCGTKQK